MNITRRLRGGLFCLMMLYAVWGNAQLQIDQPVRFLALGDSYTIGERVAAADRWPQQFFDSLAQRGYLTDSLGIIARTGWRTDDLARAMAAANLDSSYTLVSLLIGVNNQYQGFPLSGYAPDFESLLRSAMGLAGGDPARVMVLSIPDYAYTPFGQGGNPMQISAQIDAFNAANRMIAAQYGVHYFDITPISREGLNDPSLVATDGLHPSGKMYTEWVKLILQDLVDPTTNLPQIPSFSFSLNPAPPHLLRVKTPEPLHLQVIDLGGRKVWEAFPQNAITYQLNLAAGLYVLEWKDKHGNRGQKKVVLGF